MTKRTSGDHAAKRPSVQRQRMDPVAGLAGSIAHDFSNLLIVIRNATAFLRDEIPGDHPHQEYVKELLDAGERAAVLTRQLQAIGQSQLLSQEAMPPGRIVRELSDSLRRLVPEDIELRVTVRSTAHAVMDVPQFQIAVISLVTYAAEKAPSHSTIVVAVNEHAFDKEVLADGEEVSGKFVSVVVAKPGRASASEARPSRQMFAPRLTGKHTPHGTDLRLATVQGIVSQSGGYVDFSMDPARGAVFRILLPIVAGKDRVSGPRKPRMSVEQRGNAEVILLVEDDGSVRSTVRAALERHGYVVVEARDGGEAQRLMGLFNVLPDLVLTDLVMPNVTGRELLEELAIEGRMPKVLLMSGYSDDDHTRLASAAKLYPFIRKPFTHDELAAKVREVLGA